MSVDYDHLKTEYAQTGGQDATAALAEFARREVARTVIVPTDDKKVRLRLRELGEPITLFGEGPADRRDRLRHILSLNGTQDPSTAQRNVLNGDDDDDDEEEYYTPGSEDLLLARRMIAHDSLLRSRDRIAREREEYEGVPLARRITHRKQQNTRLRGFLSQGSQIAADRAVAKARFSPDGSFIATGSWAGDLRLFSADGLQERRKVTGHSDRISGLAWHPRATLDLPASSVNLVTGGGEGTVCLWDMLSDHHASPLSILRGHEARVAAVAVHPSGTHIASASFDATWRLWDTQTTAEVLLQDGHSRELYAVAFGSDGSLVASAGMDAVGRVWDLRSGKTIMVLEGHVKTIHGLDFSPNGYQLASGSADGTMKIWDLRKVSALATIPAHKSIVSDVTFFHQREASGTGEAMQVEEAGQVRSDGTFLATSGYDGAVNIWSADDWTLIKSLIGPAEKKVMSVDIRGDGHAICSSGFDRTLRLWSSDDG